MGRSSLMVAVFSVFIFQCIPCAFSQQASVSPSVLSFAPQVVNLLSPGSQPQTVTLTNTGNSELIVISIHPDCADAASFAKYANEWGARPRRPAARPQVGLAALFRISRQ